MGKSQKKEKEIHIFNLLDKGKESPLADAHDCFYFKLVVVVQKVLDLF